MIVREIADNPELIEDFDWFNDYDDTRRWAKHSCPQMVGLLDYGFVRYREERNRHHERRTIKYFVSYSFTTKDGKFGFGNVDFDVDRPTVMIEDIRGMEKRLKTQNDFEDIAIISWRMFDSEETPLTREEVTNAIRESRQRIAGPELPSTGGIQEDLIRELCKRLFIDPRKTVTDDEYRNSN